MDRAAPRAAPSTTAPPRAARRRASRSMPSTGSPWRDSMFRARARRSSPPRAVAPPRHGARLFRGSWRTPLAHRRVRASRAICPRPAPRPRRTRNTEARRAAPAMWPRRFHRARPAKAHPGAAARRRGRRASARPSMAPLARPGPRARQRQGSRWLDLARVSLQRRGVRPRSATMLSQQQQLVGMHEAIEPPGSPSTAAKYSRLYRQANSTVESGLILHRFARMAGRTGKL